MFVFAVAASLVLKGAKIAKPRVFISSAFFDLHQVRADVEKFVKEVGYEPILHERGTIPYGRESSPEEYCYREIDLCDILVALVGGRYGTESSQGAHSITQKEIKHAIETNKQVYIFVDKNVLAEHGTYQVNKGNKDVHYRHVDNVAVYAFLDELESLPKQNPTTAFESSQDIISYLRNQWSGLFQRLLRDEGLRTEVNLQKEMKLGLETIDRLVTYLVDKEKGSREVVTEILLSSHPVFAALKKALQVPYRVYFTNLEELTTWLKARGYDPVTDEEWDDPSVMEWIRVSEKKRYLLKIAACIFGKNGVLRAEPKEKWDSERVNQEVSDIKPENPPADDVPF